MEEKEQKQPIKLRLTIKDLVEAGAHFGHQKGRWHPKMKRFIFEERQGLHVIDLAKTVQQLRDAVQVVQKTVSENKSILFVGTKKQAKSVVRDCAERSGEFYIDERWLGGTLTNLQTIRRSVKKLDNIEKQISTGREQITKKEHSLLTKLQGKLERNLAGIRGMQKPPGLLIVVDPGNEHIAVAEANKLNIPVMALVDTNCNPDPIDHIIACNDDALKSIKLIIEELAQAIIDRKNAMNVAIRKAGETLLDQPKEEEQAEMAAEPVKEEA